MAEETPITLKKKRSYLQVILSTGFLTAVSTALVVYINSTFLESLVKPDQVGLVFSSAYIITLISMEFYGRLIAKLKNHRVFIYAFLIELISLVLMGLNIDRILSLLAFICFTVIMNLLVINFDLLLETISTNSETGRIRGVFYTVYNLGFLFGPLFTGMLVSKYGFTASYFLSAALIVPSILLIFHTYSKSEKVFYKKHTPLKRTLKHIIHDKDLRGIFLIAFMLYFFYSWMIIYSPLYLLELGLDWAQIGSIFTVMLIPFVLLEYPAGWLADKYLGEVEMLTLGFAIMSVSIFSLLFVSNYWEVMIVLFCSRIGASLVEIMRDTYFYKKVDVEDIDLVDNFRNTRSLAYMISPLLASAILAFGFGLNMIFVILGILLVLATVIPTTIRDTK